MGLADLHIHTIHSYDGTATVPAVLKHVADHTNLNVIAITDHDTLAGLPEALALAPRYNLEVIPGCEITTSEGHLLALFIDRPIQAGLSFLKTIQQIKAQGGICIAAHPTARGTSSVSFEIIHKTLWHPDAQGVLVGVEAFNAGLVYTRSNASVIKRSQTLPIAQVGNSDAHILKMIGHGASEFQGRSAADLRRALEQAETTPRCGSHLSGLEVLLDYIPRFLLRKLGWADWNAAPDAPLSLIRLSRAMTPQENYRAG
ncbi:MAG: PHP domain-containing protein [Anaerolineaceae bacterium]|nr:PHP domain-containing protein [Anaerolineaceae bacterium]